MSQQTIVTVNPDNIIEDIAEEIAENIPEDGISKARKILYYGILGALFATSGASTILSFTSPSGNTTTTTTISTDYLGNETQPTSEYTTIEQIYKELQSVKGFQVSSILNFAFSMVASFFVSVVWKLDSVLKERQALASANVKLSTDKEVLLERVERLSTQNGGIYYPNEPIVSNAYANPSQNLTPFENPSRYPSSTSTAYPPPVQY